MSGPIYEVPYWNTYKYNQFRQVSEPLSARDPEVTKKFYNFHEFGANLLQHLFNREAPHFDQSEVTPEQRWIVEAFNGLKDSPAFDSLAEACQANYYNSMVALECVMPEIVNRLLQVEEELEDGSGAREMGESGNEDMQEMADQMGDKAQRMADAVKDAMGKAAAIDKKLAHAKSEINEDQKMFGQMPRGTESTEDGDPTDLAAMRELSKLLRNGYKWKNMLKLVGRINPTMRAKVKKSKSKSEVPYGSIDDVVPGDGLKNLTPSELALLTLNPAVFTARLAAKELMQYKLSSKVKLEHGPLVILLDSTGSMSGERELWAKAVTWVLFQMARLQKRDCAIIHYGNGPLKTYNFKARDKNLSIQEIYECFHYFRSDGTNWERPAFDEAMKMIETDKTYKKGDIIFITDGGCDFGRDGYSRKAGDKDFATWHVEFEKRRKKTGASIFTILIEGDADELKHVLRTEDPVLDIRHLNDSTAATIEDKLFGMLA